MLAARPPVAIGFRHPTRCMLRSRWARRSRSRCGGSLTAPRSKRTRPSRAGSPLGPAARAAPARGRLAGARLMRIVAGGLRCVAEEDGRVVGRAEAAHNPWQFHPRKYQLRLEVDAAHRRQGVGGALLARTVDALRARDALLLRAVATEDDAEAVGFLTRRGFREVWREIPSELDLAGFDGAPFADRAAPAGVAITTLADELARNPLVLRELYELHAFCNLGQQELDGITPRPFEEFVAGQVEGPQAMPEAWFLARDGGVPRRDELARAAAGRAGHAGAGLHGGAPGPPAARDRAGAQTARDRARPGARLPRDQDPQQRDQHGHARAQHGARLPARAGDGHWSPAASASPRPRPSWGHRRASVLLDDYARALRGPERAPPCGCRPCSTRPLRPHRRSPTVARRRIDGSRPAAYAGPRSLQP